MQEGVTVMQLPLEQAVPEGHSKGPPHPRQPSVPTAQVVVAAVPAHMVAPDGEHLFAHEGEIILK